MERQTPTEERAAWVRITVDGAFVFMVASVLMALRSRFPAATFHRARQTRGGWRVHGILRWNDDTAPPTPEEDKGDADASPEVELNQPAQADIVVSHTDPDGARSYGFTAARINQTRLYNARFRILTNKERRAITVPLATWAITYIDTYRRRAREVEGRKISREDVIAEALALFAATHPIPASDEDEK